MAEQSTKPLDGTAQDHAAQNPGFKPIWQVLSQRLARLDITSRSKPYLNSYLGGIAIGIVLFLAMFLVGKGMEPSGALTRFGAYLMDLAFPAYADSLVFYQNYLSPSAQLPGNWLMYLLIGLVLGGLLSGIRGKRMMKGLVRGPNTSKVRRVITALAGGILVTFGALMAGGGIIGLAIPNAAMLFVSGWMVLFSLVVSGLIVSYFLRREWF